MQKYPLELGNTSKILISIFLSIYKQKKEENQMLLSIHKKNPNYLNNYK